MARYDDCVVHWQDVFVAPFSGVNVSDTQNEETDIPSNRLRNRFRDRLRAAQRGAGHASQNPETADP
jgi:hypothetical protein